MLGRYADNLYWMARYLERAENTARKIQAGLQDGSVSLEKGMKRIFTKIGDIAMDAELREKEIKKG